MPIKFGSDKYIFSIKNFCPKIATGQTGIGAKIGWKKILIKSKKKNYAFKLFVRLTYKYNCIIVITYFSN